MLSVLLALGAAHQALVRGPSRDEWTVQHEALQHRLETLRERKTASRDVAGRRPLNQAQPGPWQPQVPTGSWRWALGLGVLGTAALLCSLPLPSAAASGARLGGIWGLAATSLRLRPEVGAGSALLVLGALWGVRTSWAQGWKLAETKEPALLREWSRRVGWTAGWRVASQLRFHALRYGFLQTTWGVPVSGVPPGFSFALYLRACVDEVAGQVIHTTVRSSVVVVLLGCIAMPTAFLPPIWSFAAWGAGAALLTGLVALHLSRVVGQLAPKGDAPPPYIHQVVASGLVASKHDRLFLFGPSCGPELLLDLLRALAWAPLSVCLAWQNSWECFALALALAALHAYVWSVAVVQYATATSVEMKVRRRLVPGADRALAKRQAYRRIARHLKVQWALQQGGWEAAADAWPAMRAQQLADARALLPAELRRSHVHTAVTLVGIEDDAAVDAWFDHFAADVLPDQYLAWVVAGAEMSVGPLPEAAAGLLPESLSAESLAKALEKLKLPASEATCAELLRSLPQPRASALVRLLRSLD